MNANELSTLIEQRHAVVCQLVELGQAQLQAVQAGHMNELMQLLSRKQQPLATLGELSKQLHAAIGDDPESRQWASTALRTECRKQHEQTEQLLLQLMQVERECELSLSKSRDSIGEQIRRSDGAKQANLHYAKSAQPAATCGGSLDLSSQ
ncbi:FlgN protein [Novipirellula galeiformis]|uniref:FlgN protein n=1 Tax=Novipirellula galeiformis TaxID=2528004 RepID=A0A5C6CNY5_9BACT|nr:flagellar export chaperone FlgN [Novipirellula galeiformis]TWU26683.1 FlgN protein [Novipirellula galeiformis]